MANITASTGVGSLDDINPEAAVCMFIQNRFQIGRGIVKYTQ
jgi:hypothetical protein